METEQLQEDQIRLKKLLLLVCSKSKDSYEANINKIVIEIIKYFQQEEMQQYLINQLSQVLANLVGKQPIFAKIIILIQQKEKRFLKELLTQLNELINQYIQEKKIANIRQIFYFLFEMALLKGIKEECVKQTLENLNSISLRQYFSQIYQSLYSQEELTKIQIEFKQMCQKYKTYLDYTLDDKKSLLEQSQNIKYPFYQLQIEQDVEDFDYQFNIDTHQEILQDDILFSDISTMQYMVFKDICFLFNNKIKYCVEYIDIAWKLYIKQEDQQLISVLIDFIINSVIQVKAQNSMTFFAQVLNKYREENAIEVQYSLIKQLEFSFERLNENSIKNLLTFLSYYYSLVDFSGLPPTIIENPKILKQFLQISLQTTSLEKLKQLLPQQTEDLSCFYPQQKYKNNEFSNQLALYLEDKIKSEDLLDQVKSQQQFQQMSKSEQYELFLENIIYRARQALVHIEILTDRYQELFFYFNSLFEDQLQYYQIYINVLTSIIDSPEIQVQYFNILVQKNVLNFPLIMKQLIQKYNSQHFNLVFIILQEQIQKFQRLKEFKEYLNKMEEDHQDINKELLTQEQNYQALLKVVFQNCSHLKEDQQNLLARHYSSFYNGSQFQIAQLII